ncbi:MAG: response regulator, partial [Planctomycetota bacterium]
MKLLIVDDSTVARFLLKKALTELGHDVVAEAADGIQAIQLVAHNAYDLVVSDWNMPGLDGMDLIRALRQSERRRTPLVMVSSESYAASIQTVIAAGAQGFVTKPFALAKLREAIDRAIEIRHLADRVEEADGVNGELRAAPFS